MYIVKWGGESGGYYYTKEDTGLSLHWTLLQKKATRFSSWIAARLCVQATWTNGIDKPPCAKIVRLKKKANPFTFQLKECEQIPFVIQSKREYTSFALAVSEASVLGLDAWRVVPKR